MTTDAHRMLATHLAVWDMPTLAEQHRDILEHLSSRYHVDFDMASRVIVVHKATGVVEPFDTTDVREAVRVLLEREAARQGQEAGSNEAGA